MKADLDDSKSQAEEQIKLKVDFGNFLTIHVIKCNYTTVK